MGLNFFKIFRPKSGDGKVETRQISCEEMFELAAQELQIRELCFWICVNMVANALGRCEFRTYENGKEVRDNEYYMWNIEPNVNQNSTAFIHKLITKLFTDGECIMINTRPYDSRETLVVADSYSIPLEYPSKEQTYTDVVVGEVAYTKTFHEKDVMHLRLNHIDIRGVLNGMYQQYYKLVDIAMRAYTWGHGQHWKVHVDQIAQGDDFKTSFAQMLKEQIKPFIESNGAVLPEFDGYKYENAGETNKLSDSRDINNLVEDIFNYTARAFNIPAVLVNGKIEGTADANTRFLTNCIDPICDQIQEEATRKRYGFERWRRGDYLRVDSSSIIHFDIFANAANVEKLVGSGAFTINDVLRATGQPEINEPWANKHYMTLNIADMSEGTRQLDSDGEGGEKT